MSSMAQKIKSPQAPDSLSALMLAWYDNHARTLPWRLAKGARSPRPAPYHVWLSEIMLQQTTVETVIPRFQRFLRQWPTIEALALASQEAVLKEWAGLGYYARARNLHACAQRVTRQHHGVFPQEEAALKKLPGIGDYTAAAIRAIAFDRPANVVDGNVERIMARLHKETMPLPMAKKRLRDLAAAYVPDKRPGDYAQSLMDLGATVCTLQSPKCERCPLTDHCAAHADGVVADFPRRAAKNEKPTRFGHVFIIRNKEGAIFFERRPQKGLLGGMLGLPTSDWLAQKPPTRKPFKGQWQKHPQIVRHTFTHFHLELTVWQIGHEHPPLAGAFYPPSEIEALPTLFKKALWSHS